MTLPFSIGILSWKSPKTLHQTLTSYKENGLLDLTDDVAIYFQEISETDLAIAEEFGITKIYGDERNIGIGAAFTTLVESAKYEYVLLLENDWELVEDYDSTQTYIIEGLHLLIQKAVDVLKYRSRFNWGDPLYTLQFAHRERDCPEHMGEAMHWLHRADQIYPDVFSQVEWGGSQWFVMPSKHVSHTNNPCMHSKTFYLKHISPFSGSGVDLEGNILKYWQSSDFKVAHGTGLFKHNRID
jgi:hypothetical protein